MYTYHMYKVRKTGAREAVLEKLLEPWMLGITVLLIPMLVVPVFFDLSLQATHLLELVNIIVWLAFYGELFAKLTISTDWKRTLRHNPLLLVILLSPLLVPLRIVRIVRLVKFVRFLRLQSIVRYFKPRMQRVILNIEEMFLAVGIFAITAGFLVWQVELRNGGTIVEYDDALWWAIITITTVGYGDIVPSTSEGRIIGAVVSLVGILVFMVVVARTTAFFVEHREMAVIEKTLKHEDEELGQIDKRLKHIEKEIQ